jgi:transposase-like protein
MSSRAAADIPTQLRDETVITVTGDRFWLVAAVAPDTNIILYIRLYPSRPTPFRKMFLRELPDNHTIDDEFLVDGPPGCMPACWNSAYTPATEHTATATQSNMSFNNKDDEQTNSIIHLRASPESAEERLEALDKESANTNSANV